jgi:hypothetical protein
VLIATVVGTGTVCHSTHGVKASTSQDLVDALLIPPFGQLAQSYFMLVKPADRVSFLVLQINSQVDGPLSIIVLFVPRREIPEHEMPLLLSKSITALNPVFSWSNTDGNM